MPRLTHGDDADAPKTPIFTPSADGGGVVTMPKGTPMPVDLDPDVGAIEDRRANTRGRDRGRHTSSDERDTGRGDLGVALHQTRQRLGSVSAENADLKRRLAEVSNTAINLDQAAFEHWGAGAKARLEKAQNDYQTARDSGDAKAEAAATADISIAAVDVRSFESQKVQREALAKNPAPAARTDDTGAMTRATQAYIDANPKVRNDKEMWKAALELHEDYVAAHGPRSVDTAGYFASISEGLREEFPNEDIADHPTLVPRGGSEDDDETPLRRRDMQDDDEPAPRRPVREGSGQYRRPGGGAPVNRQPAGIGMRVSRGGQISANLTPDMVAHAKVSGVTPEQYAISLAKPSVQAKLAAIKPR